MNKTLIIAEAGVNHNGDINIAKRLVDVAVDAGVDSIKFQTFKTELVVSKKAKKANYQIENTGNNFENQFDMIKKLELSNDSHTILIDYCKKKNIQFLSSPFDLDSIYLLHNLGIDLWKIPSGEITNKPYLQKIGRLSKKVIMSTGMATMQEIKEALNVVINAGTAKKNITILHCNTEYPTPYEDVNLNAMLTIKKEFGVQIGYSDHTQGIEIPIAAVAIGATVIEKHFTLDKNMEGPDHKASLEPDELKQMVIAIRNIEKALGNGEKKPSPSEIKNIPIARKSIVAISSIKKGDILTEKNIGVKRPGDGISPMKWDEVVETQAVQDFNLDDLISR